MVEVVATEALKLILEKPICHVYKEILFAKDVKCHTKRIQNSKATFEALLLDIKSSELCSHAIQQVLSRFVREFTKFADFVDEKDARAKKQKMVGTSKFVMFFSSSNQFFTRFKDDKKIKSFMRELDFIAKDYALFGTMISTLSMNRTQEFSSLESWPRSKTDLVFGRDKENNEMLLDEVTAKTLDSLVPYKLNSLGESASWMLLKHCALTRSHELDLEAIGKDIAKLCRNVPLVLRSIGGLLATKHTSREWLAIKDQLSANGIRYGQAKT